MLVNIAAFRSKGRVPAVSWQHPLTQAVLVRCSQPKVGITRARCLDDELMIDLIAKLNNNSKTLYLVDSRYETISLNTVGDLSFLGSMFGVAFLSLCGVGLLQMLLQILSWVMAWKAQV
jgi:hypothetical protein